MMKFFWHQSKQFMVTHTAAENIGKDLAEEILAGGADKFLK